MLLDILRCAPAKHYVVQIPVLLLLRNPALNKGLPWKVADTQCDLLTTFPALSFRTEWSEEEVLPRGREWLGRS